MNIFKSFFGGLGSTLSSFNEPLLNQQYNYNLKLQQNAQDWQERMSNTAHQREVNDLRAAGINPLYTATGGNGASMGTVGAGSVNQPNIDPISAIGSMVNMFNQTNATNADAHLKGAQATHELSKLMETRASTLKILEDTKLSTVERRKALKQIGEIDANIEYLNAQTNNVITNSKYTRGLISLLGKDKSENSSQSHEWTIPLVGKFGKSSSRSYNRY